MEAYLVDYQNDKSQSILVIYKSSLESVVSSILVTNNQGQIRALTITAATISEIHPKEPLPKTPSVAIFTWDSKNRLTLPEALGVAFCR